MSFPLCQTFPSTIEEITARFADATDIEAWLFADEASRRAAEFKLAANGVRARFRSAYKPLVHAFLEEIDLAGVTAVEITYPVHPQGEPGRFLLEAYPLAGLLAVPVRFTPRADADLHYDVVLLHEDGSSASLEVQAPNRVHVDHTGAQVLSPTGWVRVERAGVTVADERIDTDFEALFATAIKAIVEHAWGPTEPFFDELRIAVTLPIADRPLPLGEEVISLTEALHEDLYFSGLEIFHSKSGRPSGDRGLQPGRIVPVVSYGLGPARLDISLRHHSHALPSAPRQSLETATAPIAFDDVNEGLEAVGGEVFTGTSYCGRTVSGRYHLGSDAPVLVSGGQHPNEPTGVVGALRAAQRLARRKNAHFSVVPLENPDGYALARELYEVEPRHMHHAARYTALGDDLEYRQAGPLYERDVREQMLALCGPALHVNLHGYPAHEWTRPLTGYVPRNFALWTVPKGFFLVLRHQPGYRAQSERLAREVARRLNGVPGLAELNARQIELYRAHAGALTFDIYSGFPVNITEFPDLKVPVTLITEYPDETIYGDAFQLGHEAQTQTVLAAYDVWQEIANDRRQ
ncbi:MULTISPECIES: peptidase M14 [unclassified Devosia]|uniref:peptidase M14 n=1 Tax=unclassified Devosia TaxID=196773 RepID=UPI0015553133|nr:MULTISPECIES: peptidase M14 [unclassified Devosia]